MDTVVMVLASGLGTGFSPWAAGTVGSLLGLPLAWWLLGRSRRLQLAVTLALLVAAVPLCQLASTALGGKDDGRIVADEFLTFPICLIGLVGPEVGIRWWVVAIAFLTCRFFDIVKPTPARQIQSLHGGLGIVADDIIASIYSLAANYATLFLVNHFV